MSVSSVFSRRVRAVVLVAAAAGLSSCSVFSGPPPETYDLRAPTDLGRVGGTSSAQILVPESVGLQVFDSERIVVMSGLRVSYYPGSQYPDKLPALIQAKTIEAFEHAGRLRAVGRPGQGLSIDFQLLTDIRAFEYADVEGVARVEISAKIMNDRNGRIVSSRVFRAEVPVPADNAVDVVTALDGALGEVLAEIVRWTVPRV